MQVIIKRKPLYGDVYWDGNDFVYTPHTGFVGKDSYIYTIIETDGSSRTLTNYVDTTNAAPVAGNISLTGNAYDIISIDVTSYVTDPDAIIFPLTITSVTNGLFGNVTFDKNMLYYQSRGYNITDSFTYTISDGQYSSTASIHITTVNGIGINIPNFIYERLIILESDMTDVAAHTANWESSYTTLCSHSANWNLIDAVRFNNASNVVESNSADWNAIALNRQNYDDVYTVVQSNSTTWMSVSAVRDLSNLLFTNLTANSAKWDSTYNTVCATSALWMDSINLLDVLSTDYQTNSAFWQSTYAFVSSNSANWDKAALTVVLQSNSGNWDDTFTIVNSSSAKWDQNKTNLDALTSSFNTSSATWDSSYTFINSNSGLWGDKSSITILSSNSAQWDSVYSQVNANSATWDGLAQNYAKYDGAYNVTKTYSGDWNNAYNTVSSSSANWGIASTIIAANSGRWLSGGADIDFTTYNLTVCGNAVFYGSLTADGDRTELNATVEATSSLAITNTGFVDALKVTKTQTTGAIATFTSNSNPVLYVSPMSAVGVNTNTPNEALTVYGNISASGYVYGKLPDTYTVFQSNSGKYEQTYSYLNPISSSISSLLTAKAGYDATTSYFQTNSASINSILTAAPNHAAAYNVVVSQSANNNTSYTFLTANSAAIGKDTLFRSKSAGYDGAYNYFVTSSAANCQINYIFDGGGANVPIGSNGTVQIPSAIRILSWTLLANTNTTTYVEVLCSSYSSFPVFRNISGIDPLSADYPKLVNSAKASSSTLTNWVTSFPPDTILQFTMPQNTAGNSVTMSLKCLKN